MDMEKHSLGEWVHWKDHVVLVDALAEALYGMLVDGGAEKRRDAENWLRKVGRLPS